MLIHLSPQLRIHRFFHLSISCFTFLVVSALLLFFHNPNVYSAQLTLAWDPNTEPELGGYKVYYGMSPGAYGVPSSVGNVTNYTLTGLTEGQVYYVAVTACDQSGNESAYSNEVSGTARESAQPRTYTVMTNPSGLQVIVDGVTYTGLKEFSWVPGTVHAVSIESPQSGAEGIRYVYGSWSDGGDRSHTITAPSSNATFMVTLKKQYSPAAPIHSPGTGILAPGERNWNDGGKTASIKKTANAGHILSGWSGDQSAMSMTMAVEPSPLEMIGAIDYPVDGQRVSGITTIDGWALDGRGIRKVEFFVDDQPMGNIAYGSTLADIKDLHPDYPDAEDSGFCVIWNASQHSPGGHKIKVRLHNLDGQTKDLEVSVSVVRFHGEFVESISPSPTVLTYSAVTAEGIAQMYDIGIEWSKVSQGFVITEINPR